MISTLKALFAGLVLGVLFAPDKGSKTRQKIADIFSDYKDEIKDFIVDKVDRVESNVHSAKKAIDSI